MSLSNHPKNTTDRKAGHASHPSQCRRDSGFRLTLPTVAPGQFPGVLRFASLALHILPQKGGRHRRYVSARKISELELRSKTPFTTAYLKIRRIQTTRKKLRRTTSLDDLAEPIYYSKRARTSSTRLFASHQTNIRKADFDGFSAGSAGPRLPILPSASTLQVFHFI
jgi:hypothetical protein